MRVKICGITSLEDAMAACEFGADAIGFNFAEEAKPKNRYIAPDLALAIARELPPFVTTVAVTVNSPLEELQRYVEDFDRVQLHGEEPPEVARALGSRCIKVFRLGPDFQSDAFDQYPAASVLVDAYAPDARGGTGKIADWNRAADLAKRARPLILAGGLTPENVAEAIATVRPYGVDTAGGVEAEPGIKDHERLKSFIDQSKVSLS